MILNPGDAFQAKGEGYHLRAVATFPDANGMVVIFNLTDAKNVEEKICLFQAKEHPFFEKLTAVGYRRTCAVPAKIKQPELMKSHPRFSVAQIQKMIEAAHRSEDIEPKYLKMLPPVGVGSENFYFKLAQLDGA